MQSINGRLCLNQRFIPTLIISVLTQKQRYNILDIKALHGRCVFLALKTKETFSVGHAIVMQKVNFYVVKGYLLQAKRWLFAGQKATFYNASCCRRLRL